MSAVEPSAEHQQPSSVHTCPYCGSIYALGTLACPTCRAALSPTGYTRYGGRIVAAKLPVRTSRAESAAAAATEAKRKRRQIWENWMPVIVLVSVVIAIVAAIWLLGGFSKRYRCTDTDAACIPDISPNYFVPVPPTPTPIGNINDPKKLVIVFFNVYGGTSGGMVQMGRLFSSEYKVRPEVLACAFQNARDTYGPPVSQDISEPIISGNSATVAVSFVSPGRRGDMTFTAKKEGVGWKIARITGWIDGDITPSNPVGESQSCLSITPTP